MRDEKTINFISRAKNIHGDKFDYSKSVYLNRKNKIKIICPEHGEFEQSIDVHLDKRSHGCPKCGNEMSYSNNRSNKDDFINKANEIHGNKFDYSKVNYLNNKTKVTIICPEHGEFQQTPVGHLDKRSNGCYQCGRNIGYKKLIVQQEDIIKNFVNLHCNEYSYDLVDYVDRKTKVTIICKKHGEFKQTPDAHLSGSGCPKCYNERNCYFNEAIKWKRRSLLSSNFDSFKFYIVKIFDGEEIFYKFGITYLTVEKRLRSRTKKFDYDYEIVKIISDNEDYEKIFGFEVNSKKLLKENMYKPMKDFSGKNECFKHDDINNFIKSILFI